MNNTCFPVEVAHFYNFHSETYYGWLSWNESRYRFALHAIHTGLTIILFRSPIPSSPFKMQFQKSLTIRDNPSLKEVFDSQFSIYYSLLISGFRLSGSSAVYGYGWFKQLQNSEHANVKVTVSLSLSLHKHKHTRAWANDNTKLIAAVWILTRKGK